MSTTAPSMGLFGSTFSSRWEKVLELSRRHPRRTDIALAGVFTMAMALSCAVSYSAGEKTMRNGVRPWPIPFAILAMLTIVWRRRFPEVQFMVSAGLCLLALLGGISDGTIGVVWIWTGFYSVSCYGGKFRTPVRLLGAVAVVLTVIYAPDTQSDGSAQTPIRGSEIAFFAVVTFAFVASAWLVGDTTRIRRVQASALILRTQELEFERDRNAQRAVTEERLRIARELHDVMAHHVTVIGMQASAAERVVDRDVVFAKNSLKVIANQSREIVDELQRLLGFLRPDAGGEVASGATALVPQSPQPSLANVTKLVQDSQASGLNISLDIEGNLDDLPGSVSLSAYRIVQEALTNIRKHAGSARTSVAVVVEVDWVHVKVHNVSGIPSELHAGSTKTGLGIVGMRERARLVGGTLTAGPSSEGGWLVEARLPLQAGAIL